MPVWDRRKNPCILRQSLPPANRTAYLFPAVVACLRSLLPHREEGRPLPFLHHRRLPAPGMSPPSDAKDKAPPTACAFVQHASRRHSERPSASEGLNAAASALRGSRFLLAPPHSQICLHERS